VKGADNLPFRTSPQIAVQLIDRALDSGMSSRAVVADCLYGSNDAFQAPLLRAGLPVAVKPKRRYLAPVDESLTVEDVLRGPGW
jgi:SRSO17 transposase